MIMMMMMYWERSVPAHATRGGWSSAPPPRAWRCPGIESSETATRERRAASGKTSFVLVSASYCSLSANYTAFNSLSALSHI